MKRIVNGAHQARMLGAVAALACGLTLIVSSLFDPFGREAERADHAARSGVGAVLCVQVATFQQRLDGITAIEHSNQLLSASDENLKDVLIDGLDTYRVKLAALNYTCPPAGTHIKTPEEGSR